MFSSGRSKPPVQPEEGHDITKPLFGSNQFQCCKCNGRGHKAASCRANRKLCFLCGRQGHEARNCKANLLKPGRLSKLGNRNAPRDQLSDSCVVQS